MRKKIEQSKINDQIVQSNKNATFIIEQRKQKEK